jgi:photosystem II stability/assembly factor-like uncharacterized protein
MKNLYKYFTLIFSIALSINTLKAQSNGWTIVASGTTSNLYGIAYSNLDTIVAVGDGGIIMRSKNSGKTWATVNSPVGDQLRGVAFNGNIGLAVGISGRMLRTTNGGATWKLLTRITTKNLYAVSITKTMAVTTGEEGTILVSTDNGVSWSPKTAGTASILFGVSANGGNAVGAGGIGAIVMSTNNGTGWGLTIIGGSLTFYYGVSLPAPLTGYTVGISGSNAIILRTDNGGFTWASQTVNSPEQLYGVSFTSTDNGTAVGTTGTILHTTNRGKKWNPEISGTTQTLNGVAFHDAKKGFVVGNGGTILRAATNCTASITPLNSLDICATGSVDLKANGGTGLTYQWMKNNINIAGATNQIYTAITTGNYKVLVTAFTGCSKISKAVTVTKSCFTSAASQQNNMTAFAEKFITYPNPSNGQFTISLKLKNNTAGVAAIEIINTVGQKVYTQNVFFHGNELQKQIEKSNALQNGIYIIRVTCGSIVFSKRIIIQK